MEEKKKVWRIIKFNLLDFDKADKKHVDLGKMIVTKTKKEVTIEIRIKAICNMEGKNEN